jgi:hypothetical protein
MSSVWANKSTARGTMPTRWGNILTRLTYFKEKEERGAGAGAVAEAGGATGDALCKLSTLDCELSTSFGAVAVTS